jgi:dTDP-4-amino-4,6-dideoxygalactose transaminase
MSPGDLVGKISQYTKAIIPVHLFGQCAAMDEIRQIASAARGIPLIEDACQSIGAEYQSNSKQGRCAGSLGWCGALGFYPTKNLGGCGDGGMNTTNDASLAAKLRVLRDHGQQPRYYHHFGGLNSRLDTLQAAVLNVKLPHLDDWTAARARHAARYDSEFSRRGLGSQLVAPRAVEGSRHVWNQYTVRVTGGRRDTLQKYLAERQIGSAVYYPVPLHLQKCFASLGYREGSLPATERAAREVLSLPVYPELTAAEQGAVIDAVAHFCQVKNRLPVTSAA